MNRRGLITGLISFAAAAPAIVRIGSIMPVNVWRDYLDIDGCRFYLGDPVLVKGISRDADGAYAVTWRALQTVRAQTPEIDIVTFQTLDDVWVAPPPTVRVHH